MEKSTSLLEEIAPRVSESTGKDVGRGIAQDRSGRHAAVGRRRGRSRGGGGQAADRLPRAADLQGTPRQGTRADRRGRAGERPRGAGRAGGGPPGLGQAGGRVDAGPAGRHSLQPRSEVYRRPAGRFARDRRRPRAGDALRQPPRRFSGQEHAAGGIGDGDARDAAEGAAWRGPGGGSRALVVRGHRRLETPLGTRARRSSSCR